LRIEREGWKSGKVKLSVEKSRGREVERCFCTIERQGKQRTIENLVEGCKGGKVKLELK